MIQQADALERSERIPGIQRLACHAMALTFGVLMAGVTQTVYRIWHTGMVALWAMVLMLAVITGHRDPFRRMLAPVLPCLVWLALFLAWGTLVSPDAVLSYGIRTAAFFFTTIAAMVVLTSRPQYLTLFATYLQLAVLINVLILVLLTFRPGYEHFFVDPSVQLHDSFLNTDRFGGWWGNSNQVGFVALVVLAMSAWAKPFMAWPGRACSAAIVFLSASRQCAWLLLVTLFLYLLLVVARKARGKWLLVLATILLGIGVSFVTKDMVRNVTSNPKVARMADYDENYSRVRGDESRLDMLKLWLPKAINGPWYGHGIASSTGDNRPDVMHQPGLPALGTHNLYLGIWIDTGLLGLFSFLCIIGLQVSKSLKLQLPPRAQWGVLSLFLVILIDSFVKHSMFYDVDGWTAYALLFVLPTSPALFPAASLRPKAG